MSPSLGASDPSSGSGRQWEPVNEGLPSAVVAYNIVITGDGMFVSTNSHLSIGNTVKCV